jgi:hypothetical protein
MLRNVLTVAFYDPFQPIFDFAESAHAGKYALYYGANATRNLSENRHRTCRQLF